MARLSRGGYLMSWEQLLDVIREARADHEINIRRVESCPNDGEPLLMGPDGYLFCPSDGWRPGVLRC